MQSQHLQFSLLVLVCVLVELLVHCTTYILKLAGGGLLPELLVWFLLLGTGVLLLIKAAGAAVNLVAL